MDYGNSTHSQTLKIGEIFYQSTFKKENFKPNRNKFGYEGLKWQIFESSFKKNNFKN